MPLSAGAQIGPYRIESLLGQGGMGEVYRACDTALKRDVALKILPHGFSTDASRTARFQREAEVLASLDHPNIASIFGMVESDGTRALALALVEGLTLAGRLEAGPLPVEQAVAIAGQIVDALEYAHDRGVVHRDLKPANIKINSEGVVKVLDFGLAKVLEDEAPPSSPANSPTLTMGHTRAGVILGTAAYMSPEQAIGRIVDRRSDIFSFGAVLFEMLTGKRAFAGATTPDVLEAVVKTDPNWSALPPETPAYLRALLERTLKKDRKQRLQAIGEVRITLANPPAPVDQVARTAVPVPQDRRPSPLYWAPIAALLFAVLALGFVAWRHAHEEPPRLIKMSVLPPEKGELFPDLGPPALSPDGRRIAFVASQAGKRALWVRELDSTTPRLLVGTENGAFPFWSPDSRSVGFGAGGKLKKINVSGGPAQTICEALNLRGGSWNHQDVILFASSLTTGLSRVSASGGTPTPATELDKARNENSHRYPWFLPDGRHFLYFVRSAEAEKTGGFVGDLESKERRQVVVGSPAIYAAHAGQGYILFLRERTLMAQPFDADGLAATGDPVLLAEQVHSSTIFAIAFTASQNGVLAYVAGGTGDQVEPRWFDRAGRVLGTAGPSAVLQSIAISPDGFRVATDRLDKQSGNFDLWLQDLARGTSSRLTFGGNNQWLVWSPDGTRLAFIGIDANGKSLIHVKSTNGTGEEEVLNTISGAVPVDWSRDGRYLFVQTPGTGKTGAAVWVLPQFGDKKLFAYLQSQFNEGPARLSPDGRWLAYVSDESRRKEIFVASFPQPGGKWQISTGGGEIPIWSRDGHELFFVSADSKMMAVEFKTTGGKLEPGVPKPLFDVRLGRGDTNFDVSKDGRFLIPTLLDQGASEPLTVVLNWPEMLKKK